MPPPLLDNGFKDFLDRIIVDIIRELLLRDETEFPLDQRNAFEGVSGIKIIGFDVLTYETLGVFRDQVGDVSPVKGLVKRRLDVEEDSLWSKDSPGLVEGFSHIGLRGHTAERPGEEDHVVGLIMERELLPRSNEKIHLGDKLQRRALPRFPDVLRHGVEGYHPFRHIGEHEG